MRTVLRDFAILAALALLFFLEMLLHPTQILYSDDSDFLTETLPAKRFLVRSWQQTGEVPLWCPYSYAGMPFIHDIKVAPFYPLHLPLYLLAEEAIGPALSWLVVFHVFAAGACMYIYARVHGLQSVPALVAGIGFMFAGKWLLHILAGGHYVLTPLAWLPLVLLGLEKAVLGKSLRAAFVWATSSGVIFGVIVIGCHPQATMYAGVFVALWSLGPTLERAGLLGKISTHDADGTRPKLRALAVWLGAGLWTVLVALAISAVAILPAIEAMTQATRGAGVASGWSWAQTFLYLLDIIGVPSPGAKWESVGAVSVIWLAVAFLALGLCGGQARFQAGVALALVIFALGGGDALQRLPGFHLFQLHSRMLLLLAIPIALLAGKTTQALLSQSLPAARIRSLRIRFVLIACFAVLLAACRWLLVGDTSEWRSSGYWWTVLGTIPLALWLLGKLGPDSKQSTCVPPTTAPSRRPMRWPAWLWIAILVVDLVSLTHPLVAVRSQEQIYQPSASVRFLADHNSEHVRVLDRGLTDERGKQAARPLQAGSKSPGDKLNEPSASPLDPALPLLLQIESLRGYNSVDVQRYKEYLKLIMNDPTPQLPRQGRFGFPILGNFPVINKSLLDLLGVRYLLEPTDSPRPESDTAREPAWASVFVDEHPRAYLVIVGGVRELPSFTVYENAAAFPRAFVVHEAAPFPAPKLLLDSLKTTDFRRRVLLEDLNLQEAPRHSHSDADFFQAAAIREYRPNRVAVELNGGPPGYLVLADVWFPGWACTVDGVPHTIRRANYLFRAVDLPEGAREVVFTFSPRSYYWGKVISAGALWIVALAFIMAGFGRFWRGSAADSSTGSSGT